MSETPTLAELPQWKAREPWEVEAALGTLTRLWEREDYQEAVRQAFGRCQSPRPWLYLSHVPETDVWLSYVLDDATRQIVVAYIDGAGEPYREDGS